MSGHDPLELKLSGLPNWSYKARQRVTWQFSGPAGRWRLLSATRASRDLIAYIQAGEVSLSKVLALLSGGVLTVGNGRAAQYLLHLPPSGSEGQRWFDCVRSQR